MNQNEQARQAAGSSYPRPTIRRSTSSASRPQWHNERPLAYPEDFDDDDEEIDYAAPARRLSLLSGAPPHMLSHDHDHETISNHSTSSNEEEWDLLDQDTRPTTTAGPSSATPPSYIFPGTWPAALHDTTLALTSVTVATTSYASALTHSGIAKAGWSIGSALASSANSHALKVAAWAVDRTGTGTDQLPRPIRGWLTKGREMEDLRRLAEQRRRARRDGRGRMMSEPLTFGDERGAFVLETGEMSSTGELVGEMRGLGGEDGFVATDTKGEVVDGREVLGERGGDRENEEEVEEADGLLRVFELDD